jgi:VWFA-related protein
MRKAARFLTAGVCGVLLVSGALDRESARTHAQQGAPPVDITAAPSAQPTFRLDVDLVTTDVIVRDDNNQFVADLTAEDFEVYEDGVRQELASLVLVHGGRAFNVLEPPAAAPREGILLPGARSVANQTAGRVFLIFVDDLHLNFRETPRARDLFIEMLQNLIHEGDMFGLVTTGPSSLSIQLTYDRDILNDALERITGDGMSPQRMLADSFGPNGGSELRYRAHVAFKTAYELILNLEQLRNRRKAVVWISSGYDFNPFQDLRLETFAERYGRDAEELRIDPFYMQTAASQAFLPGDLFLQLTELTRAANRANATFYTIDPRGLVAGPDMDVDISQREWGEHARETQNSLRVLAELTGGIAVVNTNNFDDMLQRIDAETSDYYVVGYYSSNPDVQDRTRELEIRVSRENADVWSRTSYSLRPERVDGAPSPIRE